MEKTKKIKIKTTRKKPQWPFFQLPTIPSNQLLEIIIDFGKDLCKKTNGKLIGELVPYYHNHRYSINNSKSTYNNYKFLIYMLPKSKDPSGPEYFFEKLPRSKDPYRAENFFDCSLSDDGYSIWLKLDEEWEKINNEKDLFYFLQYFANDKLTISRVYNLLQNQMYMDMDNEND